MAPQSADRSLTNRGLAPAGIQKGLKATIVKQWSSSLGEGILRIEVQGVACFISSAPSFCAVAEYRPFVPAVWISGRVDWTLERNDGTWRSIT